MIKRLQVSSTTERFLNLLGAILSWRLPLWRNLKDAA